MNGNVMKYGLDVFGQFDGADLNARLIDLIGEHFPADYSRGAYLLGVFVEELSQKVERVSEARCAGSHMFVGVAPDVRAFQKAVFSEIAQVWSYDDLLLDDRDILVKRPV